MELILCQRIRQKKKIYTIMQSHKAKKYRWELGQNEFGPGDQNRPHWSNQGNKA